MFLNGRLIHRLAKVNEAPWQELLSRHDFWSQPGVRLDDEHQDVAFHVLMAEGELAAPGSAVVKSSVYEFDTVQVPKAPFDDPQFTRQVNAWAEMHAANFGPGLTVKMGWYVIRAGGTVGFHIDGPVFLKGARVDLSEPAIQRGLIELHSARRTILPLRSNSEDRFMICQYQAPLARGELFEFSNVLPHAYFNLGPEHAVLLVTTYLVEDMLPKEVSFASLS